MGKKRAMPLNKAELSIPLRPAEHIKGQEYVDLTTSDDDGPFKSRKSAHSSTPASGRTNSKPRIAVSQATSALISGASENLGRAVGDAIAHNNVTRAGSRRTEGIELSPPAATENVDPSPKAKILSDAEQARAASGSTESSESNDGDGSTAAEDSDAEEESSTKSAFNRDLISSAAGESNNTASASGTSTTVDNAVSTATGTPINSLPASNAGVQVLITIEQFRENLRVIQGPPVTIKNDIDDAVPQNFTFVNDYVFFEGTSRVDDEFNSGCDCKAENGRNMGCEYTYCFCLDQRGGKFPYFGSGTYVGCYRELDSRKPIYECNDHCNCKMNCKTRVVQKGRKVRLEIFRTTNRGWGLRSLDPILKGQFIDCYVGEVLTDAEAERRESAASADKQSYLFSLDKFNADPDFDQSKIVVVDGQYKGGPTRFMNHSCDPNCRQFVVSNNRADYYVYDLAFFALEDIAPYTELTFNYRDDDDLKVATEQDAKNWEEETGQLPTKCLCGAEECRNYLWVKVD